jgi:hypothetical protein
LEGACCETPNRQGCFRERLVQEIAEKVPLAILPLGNRNCLILRDRFKPLGFVPRADLAGVSGKCTKNREEGLDMHSAFVPERSHQSLTDFFASYLRAGQRIFCILLGNRTHESIERRITCARYLVLPWTFFAKKIPA